MFVTSLIRDSGLFMILIGEPNICLQNLLCSCLYSLKVPRMTMQSKGARTLIIEV